MTPLRSSSLPCAAWTGLSRLALQGRCCRDGARCTVAEESGSGNVVVVEQEEEGRA